MRSAAVALLLSGVFLATASAQSNWDRSYNVSGKPALQLNVDDASVRVRSCGGCRSVNVHVDYRGGDSSRWSIAEMQAGNGIQITMKHKSEARFLGGWNSRSPEITVETPAETDLTLRSGDGSLSLAGLHGNVDAHTGDGSIAAEDLAGALRLTTGDGSIELRRAQGTLYATTGDGSMNLEGRLSQFETRSGDGSVRLRLLPGSLLSSSSSLSTGDGSIALSVPGDLRANVEATTGDGSIHSSLSGIPNPSRENRNHVRGSLNGGGPLLRLRSGDGSISIGGS